MNKPVFQINQLSRKFGAGCPDCDKNTGANAGTNQCRRCKTIVALNKITLTIPQGEIFGIIGESGSGKSTLLRLLYGHDTPTTGHIVYYDRDGAQFDIGTLDNRQRRRLQNASFGFVYQNPHLGLNFRVTAGGNIAERIVQSGVRRFDTLRGGATTFLERVNVPTARMDETPTGFSGGMQQRVQIAKALATEPAVLFLDEITTSLDLSVQAKILDLVLDLHRRMRISILLVTHDIGVARMLAGHCVVMRHGQIVEAGLMDQILEDPQHAYTQELIGAAL